MVSTVPPIAFVLSALILAPAAAQTTPAATASTSIERFDPQFDAIIPLDAQMERIAGGFDWLEGPVWSRTAQCLYFSDIPENIIYRWTVVEGPRAYLHPAGYSGTEPFAGREPGSNGLAIDSAGRLIICEHGDRRITRLEKDGTRTVLADGYEGKRLNSPNDCVLRKNGQLCFTDPPFGLPNAFSDPGRELDFSGVFCLAPDGSLTLMTKELRAPNGLAYSPKEDVLYLSNADRDNPVWMAYPISSDGRLGPGRIFASAAKWTRDRPGGPDGIKVDHRGNIFAVGPGGVYVFSDECVHLGSLLTHTATSNCAFGEDGSSLFITAGSSMYRVRTTTHPTGP
jgi:gluconolactonase